MQRLQPKSPLLVETNTEDLTANENEQSKIIQAKKQFSKKGVEIRKIKPTTTKQPFTQIEIRETIYLLKNNKSAGSDGIIEKHSEWCT